MPNNPIPLLQSLPVEILYRIFDSLDAQTILFSLRNTCRRLKAIANNYDRYVLNFKSISKSDFHLLCRLIVPGKVISLTLCQDDHTLDQIEFFLSFYGARRFSRLRSLTLLAIEERHLKLILSRVNMRSLISFSLQIRKSDDRYRNPTAKLLSLAVAQPNLLKFELDFQPRRVEQIRWPAQCTINYLRIGAFGFGAFGHICTILRCSPQLTTLVISCSKEIYYFEDAAEHPLPAPFRQLTSLTFENVKTKIDYLELFLSLTPSLIHLKVIGNGHFLDGNRWEQFIQANLPLLDKFEFSFSEWQDIQQTQAHIEQIIASYRTPFWIEHKKWFVTCGYNIDSPRSVELYSIPFCEQFLQYQSESKKVSISTLLNINDIDIPIMDNVNKMMLDFTKLMPSDMDSKGEITSSPLFGKLRRLELAFHANRPLGWIPFLWTLVDLTTVTEIQLTSELIEQADPDMLADIANLLQRTCNLCSLDIHADRSSRESRLTAENICFMTPSHVKHLATSIKNVDEVEIILEQLEHLLSAKFYFSHRSVSNRISAWLVQKKKCSTYRASDFSVCVWLGKNSIQRNETNISNKRMKLIDDHHDS